MQNMPKTVHFLPDDVKVTVEEGENLLNIAANAGVYIHAFCGGEGVCGKCKVRIEEGFFEKYGIHSRREHVSPWQEEEEKGLCL